MIQLYFSLFLLASLAIVNAISRCEYVCNSDLRCIEGECVMTYCIDNPYCFRFCYLCNTKTECYENGNYCYLLFGGSNTLITNCNLIYFALIAFFYTWK